MLGIFDSGLGGLTVTREILAKLPEYQFLYLGDTARLPYGNKSPESVKKYAQENVNFLVEKGVKVIVVACNTASALASDELKKKFNLPIFEVITLTCKKAWQMSRTKRIGVIGTRATIVSNIYEKKIKELARDRKVVVLAKACPLLVPLVEEGWLKKGETKRIVKSYLQGLKTKGIDVLILACTHYPLLKKTIQAVIGKRITVIDSAESIVEDIKEYLKSHPDLDQEMTKGKPKENKFFVTDLTPHFQHIAEKFLDQKIKLEKVTL